MLQLLLLCICCSLYAGQPSTSQPELSENLFNQLNIRPTFNIPECHEQSKHGHLMALQSFLPIICPLLEGITLNKPLDDLRSLMADSEHFSTLYGKQTNPFAVYLQHTAHTLDAFWRLQTDAYAQASVALQNAFVVAHKHARLKDASPLCIPLAVIVAEKLASRYPELLDDLEIPEQFVPVAYNHTAQEVQQHGQWTIDDVHALQWYTALCQGKVQQYTLELPTYTRVAEKIRALGIPEINELFLHSQLDASIHASNTSPTEENRAYVRATARTYSDYLYTQNPSDYEDRALQLLCIASNYGDPQAGIQVGEIFHQRALDALTNTDQHLLYAFAENYFNIVKQQRDNPELAARAAFNLLKVPQETNQNDASYLKSATKRFSDFIASVGQRHPFVPLAQAYLAVQYRDLATLESSAHLKKLYLQRAHDSTKKVISSGNLIARNFLACKDLMKELELTKGLPSTPTKINPIIAKLNTMLSGSTPQTEASTNSKAKAFNLDTVMATFDHTIGFENTQHAAHAWTLRAQAELLRPEIDYAMHQTCLRIAYKLAPHYPLTINLLREDLNRLFKAGALQDAEELLNALDAICQTTRTLFWRANLEQQKDNTLYALALYELSGLPKAWYNAGAIYHHGDGATVVPNLDTARSYYQKALELEPCDTTYCLRSLADIAATQGRYQDQLKLLEEIITKPTVNAKDAYDLAKLLLSDHIDNPNINDAYKAFELTCALILQEEKSTALTAEQLNECSDITNCLQLQTRQASQNEIALLRQLAKKGMAEAYHALAYQQILVGQNAVELEKKNIAITVAKFYTQQALDINPTSKRTIIRLARFTKPTTSWRSFTTMSDAEKKDFEDACALYERAMATKEPHALFVEASQAYATMLAHVCTEYDMAQERLLRAVELGSSTAYLTLFKLYIENNKEAEINKIVHLCTTFNDFKDAEDRARFADTFGLQVVT